MFYLLASSILLFAIISCEKEKVEEEIPVVVQKNDTTTTVQNPLPPDSIKIHEVIDFENLTLAIDTYKYSSGETDSFYCKKAKFKNYYSVSMMYWDGFAYSNMGNDTTSGYTNQLSAYIKNPTHNKYVVYTPSFTSEYKVEFSSELDIKSLKVNNSTYAALSMKNGDSFAKKFGGASGNDQDWFKLSIVGYKSNGAITDTVDFYLADYRFVNNSEDYIINKWTAINISSLGKISKLKFLFSSSDNGTYGMNTPAYVCIDDIDYIKQ